MRGDYRIELLVPAIGDIAEGFRHLSFESALGLDLPVESQHHLGRLRHGLRHWHWLLALVERELKVLQSFKFLELNTLFVIDIPGLELGPRLPLMFEFLLALHLFLCLALVLFLLGLRYLCRLLIRDGTTF